MLIPSIDLMGGKAVQLKQGKELVLTAEQSPEELIQNFNRYGDVAVIDIDAALGQGDNIELIKQLCRQATVRVGGGIRTVGRGNELLRAGADKIIIGTSATPEFLDQFPKNKVLVALDHVNGIIVDKGWTHSTGESVFARAEALTPYCSGFLCTFVQTEGTMQGLGVEAATLLQSKIDLPITIAGGIATTEEASALCRTGVDVQIGMALYQGKLSLADTFIQSLKFDSSGLIPTIVQDAQGQVLMLAYSNKESLKIALEDGIGMYYSRSRQDLWEKGANSGHVQDLITARADCDRDAILFTVEQTDGACHTNSYSCFGSYQRKPKFSVSTLYETLKSRKATMPEGSYTSKLLQDRDFLISKLMEEANEVATAHSKENLRWELGDLTYFMSVLAVAEGLEWQDVLNQLAGRHR